MTPLRSHKPATAPPSLLLFICLSLSVRTAFGFCGLNGDDEHQKITTDALDTENAGWRFGHKTLAFQDDALLGIRTANVQTDDTTKEASLPSAHFDNEQFAAASYRLIELRFLTEQLIKYSALEPDDLTLAWETFGRALHTLQDFYSHSNWIQSNDAPNPKFGREVMDDPSKESKSCSDSNGETLLDNAPLTTGYWAHACDYYSYAPYNYVSDSVCSPARCGDQLVDRARNGLILPEECSGDNDRACRSKCDTSTCFCNTEAKADFSFWTGDDLIPPLGKCLHGWNLDGSYVPSSQVKHSGINKDCTEHAEGELKAKATKAKNLATRATLAYWLNIRDAVLLGDIPDGEVRLCRFYGYTKDDCTSCGNGILNGEEECDDGGTEPRDGCSETCTVETGWQCSGEPSACKEICGDGIRVGTEECDDGNLIDGDGCSADCKKEYCGDGIRNNAGKEQCDGVDGACPAGHACSPDCVCAPANVIVDFADPVLEAQVYVPPDPNNTTFYGLWWTDQLLASTGIRLHNVASYPSGGPFGFTSLPVGWTPAEEFGCHYRIPCDPLFGCDCVGFGRPIIIEAPGGHHRILSLTFVSNGAWPVKGYRGLLPPPGPDWGQDSWRRGYRGYPLATGSWLTGWPQMVEYVGSVSGVLVQPGLIRFGMSDAEGFDFITIGEGPRGTNSIGSEIIWVDDLHLLVREDPTVRSHE